MPANNDEISLVEIIRNLLQHKVLILLGTLGMTLLFLIVMIVSKLGYYRVEITVPMMVLKFKPTAEDLVSNNTIIKKPGVVYNASSLCLSFLIRSTDRVVMIQQGKQLYLKLTLKNIKSQLQQENNGYLLEYNRFNEQIDNLPLLYKTVKQSSVRAVGNKIFVLSLDNLQKGEYSLNKQKFLLLLSTFDKNNGMLYLNNYHSLLKRYVSLIMNRIKVNQNIIHSLNKQIYATESQQSQDEPDMAFLSGNAKSLLRISAFELEKSRIKIHKTLSIKKVILYSVGGFIASFILMLILVLFFDFFKGLWLKLKKDND